MVKPIKDLEVKITLKNNLLKERRTNLGLSAAEISTKIGISYVRYLELEGMRISPLGRISGRKTEEKVDKWQWTRSAMKIADFFRVEPGELFPNSLISIKNPTITRKVDSRQLVNLISGGGSMPIHCLPPDTSLERDEMSRLIDASLNTLDQRERDVLMKYLGFEGEPKNLTEIGREYDISGTRVNQIFKRAISKMRHPLRSKILKDYIDTCDDKEMMFENENDNDVIDEER